MAEPEEAVRAAGMAIARAALAELAARPSDPLAARALDAALELAAGGGAPCAARLLVLADLAREGGEQPDWARQAASLPGARRPAPAGPSAPTATPPAPVPAGGASRPAAPGRRPSGVAHRLFVDGCNFLGSAPGYTLGDEGSRARLAARLQQYARRHPSHLVTAVFDGRAPRSQVGNLETRGAGADRSADDTLIAALERLEPAERRAATLVTDDGELAIRARTLGATVRPVSWLHERLHREEPAPEPAEKPAAGRAEGWEEFFSRPPQRPSGRKRGR